MWPYFEKEMFKPNLPRLEEMMASWVKKKGFPLVTITRNYQDGSLKVQQDPFPNKKNWNLWWIFVDYCYADGNGQVLGDFWMENVTQKFVFANLHPRRGLIANLQHAGYYIVNYDNYNWDLIARILHRSHYIIDVRNREQITSDLYWLYLYNVIEDKIVQNIYSYLAHEEEFIPWTSPLKLFKHMLKSNMISQKRWIRILINQSLSRLGYITRADDTPMRIKLRSALLDLSCEMEEPQCIIYARQQFYLWKQSQHPFRVIPIPPDYQEVLITAALKHPSSMVESQENERFILKVLDYERVKSWPAKYQQLLMIVKSVPSMTSLANMSHR